MDDLRESPALRIATALAERYGERIVLVDPHVPALPDTLRATGAGWMDLDSAERACALGLMLVDHAEFRREGPPPFVATYDCRGVWRDGGARTVAAPPARKARRRAA